MGSGMQIFKNEQFGEIRTVVIDGEPWFVAVDVCRALEIVNSRDALTRIDEDEKGVVLTDTPGGKQEVTTVNEPGLYSLVLGSRKPEAKVFKRWITHEVIPSIRKNGGYIAGQETMSDVELMARALIVAQNVIEEKNRQISGLTEENLLMKPKAEYFDDLVDRKLLTNFRDTAKEFHIGQKRFIAFLTDNGYAYRDARGRILPHQKHVDAGLFELKECRSERSRWAGMQTLITPRGRETFRLLLNDNTEV